MIARYRIYIAYIVAPVIGLMTLFFVWFQPSVICTEGLICFKKLPASVILVATYLFYIGMFLMGISHKARELYGETGLPFWRLAVESSHRPLLATIFVTSLLLFSKWPGTLIDWLDTIFAILLPILAAFNLYASWYLIVGKHNKQIKLDVQEERTFAA